MTVTQLSNGIRGVSPVERKSEDVRKKCHRLGLTFKPGTRNRWSQDEHTFLMNNAASMTAKELNVALVANFGTIHGTENVRHRCKKLGLQIKSAGKHAWTDEEVAFLRENHGDISYADMADALGISLISITCRMSAITAACGKMKRQTPWMESMVEKIEGLGKSVYEVANEFWQSGVKVDIEENEQGYLAAFARIRS